MEVFLTITRKILTLQSFLHVRGGVSKVAFIVGTDGTFSLRSWRCFSFSLGRGVRVQVFSTSVEVFLDKWTESSDGLSFLHVRGGVSMPAKVLQGQVWFSPRSWRCF